MNRADVLMVNQSLQGLSDSLLRQKMMEQQTEEREADRQMRQQLAADTSAARQQQYKAQQQHWQKMEGVATASADAKTKENAHKMWSDTIGMYGKWVKEGIMKPDVAQNALQQAYQQLPAQAKTTLADHPSIQAMQAGQFSFTTPPVKPGHPPAVAAVEQAIEDFESRADDLEATDPQGAKHLRDRAQWLRTHAPRPSVDPTAYETQTTEEQDPNNPLTTIRKSRKVPVNPPATTAGAGSISPQGFLKWKAGATNDIPSNPFLLTQ